MRTMRFVAATMFVVGCMSMLLALVGLAYEGAKASGWIQ